MINNINVFGALNDNEHEAIEPLIHWKAYHKDDVVFDLNDEEHKVYLLESGQVRATTFSFSGKEIAYQNLDAGDIFGEIASLDGGQRTTSIVCTTECNIGIISKSDFDSILEAYRTVAREVMLRLVGMIRFLCGRVYEFSALGVKERIRAEIVRAARRVSETGLDVEITDMPTHEEIANRITTHREAVTKEFSYLTKQELIKKEGKTLIVPDVQALANLITEEI